MTTFDADKFEDKYVHYFTELQRAYKQAFEHMNETYDSELIHAIDQHVLNESEPFYNESTGFEIELPSEPYDRVSDVILVDEEKFDHILAEYVERIEDELEAVFGLSQPKG